MRVVTHLTPEDSTHGSKSHQNLDVLSAGCLELFHVLVFCHHFTAHGLHEVTLLGVLDLLDHLIQVFLIQQVKHLSVSHHSI